MSGVEDQHFRDTHIVILHSHQYFNHLFKIQPIYSKNVLKHNLPEKLF